MMGAPSRWPSHCRIYRVLRDASQPLMLAEIAKMACVSDHRAGRALIDLRGMGLCHIANWRRTKGGGSPAALWCFGYGVDAPRPQPLDEQAVKRADYHARKARVTDTYGHAIWKRMRLSRRKGGPDLIVQDGSVIYRRKQVTA